ncbi:MAG TPA: ABC transporter ATP-binding protein [Deinococcales bacterium]|nr:ABC transporter ATP-binding protein [Deinococcales bacterium]
MADVIMEARNLSRRFGGLVAVNDVSFSLTRGEILAVIGPNGAGKTTLLNLLSGVYRPDTGSLSLEGHDITHLAPEERCRKGLGRAFQVAQPFPEMTVLENVVVGATFGGGLPLREARERALEVLDLTGLSAKRDEEAHNLTLIEDKKLEVARAIATNPTVLLLDEVMAGLRPAEGREAIALVKRVRESGVSVLFIEHVMPVVRDLADRVVVMDQGAKIAEGSYAEVTREERVIEAYLGRDDPEVAA